MTNVILEAIKLGATREYIERRLKHWKAQYPELDVFIGAWKGGTAIVGTDNL